MAVRRKEEAPQPLRLVRDERTAEEIAAGHYRAAAEAALRRSLLPAMVALIMQALGCDHTQVSDEDTAATLRFQWGYKRWVMRIEPEA